MKGVLFDLDDTLYPERSFVDGGFRAVARFLAPRVGRSAPSLAARLVELHDRDGRGRLFDTLLAELGRPDDPDLVLACLLVYRTHRPRLAPFPGVEEALDALRAAGLRTGLVSDGHASVQRCKLRALGPVARRLDVVVLTDELGPDWWKPSPAPFRVACRLLDVESSEAAYVANDRRKDFTGARQAGLLTIRCGLRPDEGGGTMETVRGEEADIVIGAFASLPELLIRSLAAEA
ncbi:MAG TPA: HAD family hydrolase [Candidatus Limnocylindrales bacterium]